MKIEEYRKTLKDEASSDELIQQRLDYLEAWCRSVIRIELEKHLSKSAKRAIKKVKGDKSPKGF